MYQMDAKGLESARQVVMAAELTRGGVSGCARGFSAFLHVTNCHWTELYLLHTMTIYYQVAIHMLLSCIISVLIIDS